ncbi:MAG: hypothetical protein RL701_6116 [Pseudomonadota bacterium]
MSESARVLSRTTGVIKRFGTGEHVATVLQAIELEIAAGELTLLMGPSGSGKTTLVSILAGLLWPSEGRVELCGSELPAFDEARAAALRREHVGFIFQGYNLFPGMSALDNVALGYRLRGFTRNDARNAARAALAAVGLASRAEQRPGKLSSGQKQRVAIARALAGEPALVIGDEPTAALDSATAMSVMGLLRERVTPQSGVLIVTHDVRMQRFAHRTVHIEDGRIVGDERHAAPAAVPDPEKRERRSAVGAGVQQ